MPNTDLRPDEVLDYKNEFLFDRIMEKLTEDFPHLNTHVKSTVVHELFCILLKYDHLF